ncbi:MAG: rRNA maturation RNase YbeY [Terriglobia bacterium]
MIYNHQRKVRLNIKAIEGFASELRREMKLGRRWFDVAFVNDLKMRRLNTKFRRKQKPTDVLSFPWVWDLEPSRVRKVGKDDLNGFTGDVIISAETARRDAAEERSTLDLKIRQLMLHGVLHLLGYDHETDDGEMHALEYKLRRKFRIDSSNRSGASRKSMSKRQVNARPQMGSGLGKGVIA